MMSRWIQRGVQASTAATSCCGLRLPYGGLRQISTPSGDVPDIRLSLRYCIDLVRQYDYENWLWIGLLPQALVPKLVSIRAFAIEMNNIEDAGKEAPLMALRYQVWLFFFPTKNVAIGCVTTTLLPRHCSCSSFPLSHSHFFLTRSRFIAVVEGSHRGTPPSPPLLIARNTRSSCAPYPCACAPRNTVEQNLDE